TEGDVDIAAKGLTDQVIEADRDDLEIPPSGDPQGRRRAGGPPGFAKQNLGGVFRLRAETPTREIQSDSSDPGPDRLDPQPRVGLALREDRDDPTAGQRGPALGERVLVVDRPGVIAAAADRHRPDRPQ